MTGWYLGALRVALSCALVLALSACAGSGSDPADPYEGFNRGVTDFNRAVDHTVVRPVAVFYRDDLPTVLTDRIHDELFYLHSPVFLINNLLEGEWDRADRTVQRFVINSILGIGGLFDVAVDFGIEPAPDDFGITLATYGVDPGPFLVLPLLGPSDLRDTAGYAVDIGLDPLTYFFANPANKAEWYGAGRTVLEVFDTRSRIISVTDDLERNSLDYYTSMKSFYLQHRADEVRNGRAAPGEADLPSFPGQARQE